MNKLKNSKVCYDNQCNVYKPGDILTGYVEINLDVPETVRGVCIVIRGKAYVHWSENSGSKYRRRYRNTERYFKEKIYVVGGKNDSNVELPAGKCVYPFKYLLPSNLPPSFCDETHVGKIIYKVKAILDRPWKFNKYVEEHFIVVTPNNQDNPQITLPQILEMKKQFGLISKSKPLYVIVKTKNSGFHKGDIIPIIIDVYNDSDIDVKSISVKLRQSYKFHTNTKTKIYGITISKNHIEQEIKSNTSIIFNHTLTVPDDWKLFDLTYCNIIDLIYEIKVELHTAGLTRNLVGSLPMIPIMSKEINTIS